MCDNSVIYSSSERVARWRTGLASLDFLAILTSLHAAKTLPYRNPDLPVAQRLVDLIAQMTLEENVGQMCQYNAA